MIVSNVKEEKELAVPWQMLIEESPHECVLHLSTQPTPQLSSHNLNI